MTRSCQSSDGHERFRSLLRKIPFPLYETSHTNRNSLGFSIRPENTHAGRFVGMFGEVRWTSCPPKSIPVSFSNLYSRIYDILAPFLFPPREPGVVWDSVVVYQISSFIFHLRISCLS